MSNDDGSSQQNSRAIEELLAGTKTGILHISWYASWLFDRSKRGISRALGIDDVGNNKRNYRGNLDNTNMIDSTSEVLQVVGVGYGRTGTYSLGLALNQLGLPTLHTQHLYETPEILDMWTEQVFNPAIEKHEISMGKPDFDVIASHGYRATVDLPMALYFEQIYERYPEDCKFILTTRDTSEEWFNSFRLLATSISHTTNMAGHLVSYMYQLASYWRWLLATVDQNSDILSVPIGMPLPPLDKRRAIESYEEHNRRVRELIPVDRLLEYNVKQGWQPLCDFLEVENCPIKRPFPKTNSALSIKAQTVTAMVAYFTILICITVPIANYAFEKVTGQKLMSWIKTKVKSYKQYSIRKKKR
uniref:Sulfotransferase domain-containing protein n=1 Tax=Chaetoceros debilis TaxID=122233 RepID=A0A7S3Q327_9STRA